MPSEEMGRTGAVVAGPAELEPALLRLAVVRANDQEARRILETLPARGGPWDVDTAPARLDALLSLGEPSDSSPK